jgi:hypothetical protein
MPIEFGVISSQIGEPADSTQAHQFHNRYRHFLPPDSPFAPFLRSFAVFAAGKSGAVSSSEEKSARLVDEMTSR